MKKNDAAKGGGIPRRKIIQKLSIFSLTAPPFLIPAKWTRPVIEQVMLPAHAVTSVSAPGPTPGFLVSVTPQFDCNSIVPFSEDVFAVIAVSPAPEIDRQIAVNIGCTDNQTNLTLSLDSAGTANITISANALCESVIPDPINSIFTRLILTASYQNQTATCMWDFETEAMEVLV